MHNGFKKCISTFVMMIYRDKLTDTSVQAQNTDTFSLLRSGRTHTWSMD